MDPATRAAEEQAVERPLPSHVRYFAKQAYSINTQGQPFADQYVLQHTNGLCIVGVAPSHAMLQNGRKIASLRWKVDEKRFHQPQGKGKKHTHYVVPTEVLCTVTCDDGSEHVLYSNVAGQLLEQNSQLAVNPLPIADAPYQEGYLAVIFPKRENLETCVEHLLTQADYEAAIAARGPYPAPQPSTKDFVFIGVSTGASTINKLFPVWAPILGLDGARLVGLDFPVDVDRASVRAEIQRLHADTRFQGALVTTHKLTVHAAAADLFEALDDDAGRLGEVSCISRTPSGGLAGAAVDVQTSTHALSEFLAPTHWADHPSAAALILGAGGAGVAIATSLLRSATPPAHVTLTDVSEERLKHAETVLGALQPSAQMSFVRVASESDNDAAMAPLAPGSLVINATGMGKDRPGCPINTAVALPEGCIFWELNYRGERAFMHVAQEQAAARGLRVVDGWGYFLHGWSTVISVVFGIPLTPELMDKLKAAAEALK